MVRIILLQSVIVLMLPIFCVTNKLVNIKFQQIPSDFQQVEPKSGKSMTLSQLIDAIYRNPQSLLDMKNVYIEKWPTFDSLSTNQAAIQESKAVQPNKVHTSKTLSTAQPIPTSQTQFKQSNLNSKQNIKNSVPPSEGKASTSLTSSNSQATSNSISSNLRSTVTNSLSQNGDSKQNTNLKSAENSSSSNIIKTTLLQGKPAITASLQNLRLQMVGLTNNLRKKYKVKQLAVNSLLTKIAQDHSNDMAARNFFDHLNPDGERVGDRAKKNNFQGSIGQNLAFAPTLTQAQMGFENSPTHFANAIKSNWQQMGVGIAVKGPMMYVTVLFSPKDIARNKLSNDQIEKFKVQLSNAMKTQSLNLKTYDTVLSQYIQQYLQGNREKSLMSYVVSRGKYRSPMTAASYTMDYTNDFVNRAIENKYFQNQHKSMSRFGIGIVQNLSKLQINAIYM